MGSTPDLVLTNAEVRPTPGDGAVTEAVSVRDGRVFDVGSSTALEATADGDTRVIDCEGRAVLPGFIDAHTHLVNAGRHLVHADLSGASSRDEAIETLRDHADDRDGWVFGFGYDESAWDDDRLLRRDDLSAVAGDRPVVAFRVDMHTASLDAAALDRLAGELPPGDVETRDGEPTGLVVEEAVSVARRRTVASRSATRDLLLAAIDHALERGITTVHELVRKSEAPRIYRELDREGELDLRVRVNYWVDHLDAVIETGLLTNHGSGFVEMGAMKTYTDGAIGGRTARLFDPYADGDGRGQWVVDPEALRAFVDRADGAGLQFTAHAIGDAAIEEVLNALEATDDPGGARHRIEHVELASDDHLERLAEAGIVASMQPNFLKWAGDGGLYDRRLGETRSRASNRFRDLVDAGVHVAFGSDCMPIDPLYGIHQVVNARDPRQRLTVGEAVAAYTRGGAYAGFAEDRLGTLEPGTLADAVVLERSPWEHPAAIDDIDVWRTIVDGRVVHAAADASP